MVLRHIVWERGYSVDESIRADLQAIWRQLSQRHDWQLVHHDDEEAFFNDVLSEYNMLEENKPHDARLRLAIQRAYSVLLYRGIWQRQDRAAQELWLAVMRLALKDGFAEAEAQELAQETIFRVIDKLATVRTPHSLITWTFMIFRTVRRDIRKQREKESSLQPETEGIPQPDVADPADLATEVEHRLGNAEMLAFLQQKVPNALERLVLVRVILLGDKPIHVAQDLAVPLHRTRLAKHRALVRLRNDEEFVAMLRDRAGVYQASS